MKKNLVKKALLPAIVAVLCSLIALTSVSYAWFTLGREASVGEIEVNVTAAEGLQISATGAQQTWKSILPVDELEALTNQNQFVEEDIFPVSSAGKVVGGKLQLFDGVVENDVLTATAAKELDANDVDNFIAFDIYVKLDAVSNFLLSAESSVTGTDDQKTETAVRVAFVNLGTAATKDAVDSLTTSVGTAEAPATAQIWEPNSTTDYTGAPNDKKAYSGVAAAGENPTTSSVNTFDFSNSSDQILFSNLEAGITKIRVYIWLEGQDVDCINDISGGGFAVNLLFKLPDEE